ncbi:MAG: polysaccharide deacetylase family protein [Candidatus Nomurabacteria bacterium]|nr:MAG: polysaccharide deacetylase family protein [Candidatus Nomurabacteria bacterium]
MPAYQRYARYQERKPVTNAKLFRWILYVVALIIVVVLIQRVFGKGDTNSADTAVENSTTQLAEVTNTNTETNENADANTNTSVAPAVAEDFDVATQCDGVISVLGGAKKMTLTFSGRGNGANVDEILQVLQEANAPASFFFTGTFARNNPDVVQKISDAGYRIYNQSDTHPDFEDLTEDEALLELEAADEEISGITNLTTKPFFRPPFGSVDQTVTDIVMSAGYCPVTWTVDGLDWQAGATAADIEARVMSRAANGGIVLLQVGGISTEDALPTIITELRDQGYELVSLADLVAA